MSFLTSRMASTSKVAASRFSLASPTQRYFSARPATMAANLTSDNISKITYAEKKLTGQDQPVKGGPTAQAQKHANEPITSQTLHDITEGEKKITGGERVKGGPTSTAQSILSKVIQPPPMVLYIRLSSLNRGSRTPINPTKLHQRIQASNRTVELSTPIPFPKSLKKRNKLLAPMNR